jgi:hypothetical protein
MLGKRVGVMRNGRVVVTGVIGPMPSLKQRITSRHILTSRVYATQLGGLAGLQPAKNYPFLVVFSGFAGEYHQKNG